MSLQIIQAKPNPAGKDSSKDRNGAGAANPEQLFGEWVDIKNTGNDAVRLSTIQIRHAIFDEDCYATGEMELYWTDISADFLKPNQVLRVHAGRREDSHRMVDEDRDMAEWHGYAESDDFILNNRCGDKIVVTWRDAVDRVCQDWACYAPHPPEGLVLKRSGNLLAGAGVGLSLDQ